MVKLLAMSDWDCSESPISEPAFFEIPLLPTDLGNVHCENWPQGVIFTQDCTAARTVSVLGCACSRKCRRTRRSSPEISGAKSYLFCISDLVKSFSSLSSAMAVPAQPAPGRVDWFHIHHVLQCAENRAGDSDNFDMQDSPNQPLIRLMASSGVVLQWEMGQTRGNGHSACPCLSAEVSSVSAVRWTFESRSTVFRDRPCMAMSDGLLGRTAVFTRGSVQHHCASFPWVIVALAHDR
jgi:hypothetical protein